MEAIKTDRAFVMVEVIVAAVIIIVALTAVGGLLRQALRASAAARHQTTAVELAQDKLEQLKLAGFTAVSNATGQEIVADPGGAALNFSRVTDVQAVDDKTVAVTVSVSWQEPGASAAAPWTVRLVTYYIRAFDKEF